jgi:hypothetical protein
MIQYEIIDDKKVLFSGDPRQALEVWSSIWGSDKINESEKEKEGRKLPFETWEGSLRLISKITIDEHNQGPGMHSVLSPIAKRKPTVWSHRLQG